jgi:putative ABC transport system permease protein
MAMTMRLDIEGRPSNGAGDDTFVGYSVVTPGYLRVLGQPIARGREFVDADTADSVGVAIINQTMASRFWPNEDPIGRQIRPTFSRTDVPWAVDAQPRWLTIVGVADDIKEFRLDETARPVLYVTYKQFPTSFMYLTVRTATAPAALAGSVQREIAVIDRDQPVYDVRTMDDAIAAAVPRFHVALLGVFAAVALLLSAVGVYGVMSYIVGQRTQEIGIRMALGASARQVMVAMMREVAALGVLGIAVGLVAATGLTRLMSGMLFGVAPTDARAFAGVAALLLAVALTACGIPARRATRVDPTVALRCE